MAFCTKCGAELEEGAKFCALCGEATEAQSTADSVAETVKEKFNEFNNTADTTNEYDPADIENNKVMAVLAYFGLLLLVPLLAAKDSKYARFHTNQGLVLFLAEIVSSVVGLVPLIGGILSGICSIFLLVVAIIGIVNAATGKAKELPLIGKISLIK
ncbi:MAG: zinc-ribbon domain-containing protein [Oscillospiraceae bacterium]|nr:zinc-ribbon domain-containing protein [Oscillospiraceae bacterium]